MSDPSDGSAAEASTGDKPILTAPVTATYKVLGALDAATGVGVLGQNDAASGTPIGVKGAVPNAGGGYGLETPDDARVAGVLEATDVDTTGDDFTVAAGTTGTNDAANVVLGHASNGVNDAAVGATIGGGGYDDGSTAIPNRVFDDYGTIGGGWNNQAGSDDVDPGTAKFSTVGGGSSNDATGGGTTVCGGRANTAGATEATVGGGSNNTASAGRATIAGGIGHDAHGERSTIGGGQSSRTGVSGTTEGFAATVPGGSNNVASDDYSFAAGRQAEAVDQGAFVWADSTVGSFASDQSGTSGSPTGVDTFHVLATGGVRLVTGLDGSGDPNAGAYLDGGGSSWNAVSTRRHKHDVRPVDPGAVLDGVESLTISRWAYDARPGVDRMGPMAGEFSDAFGLGEDPETIGHVDADGVALAAIQGLSARLDDARDEIAERDERIDRQADRIDELETENGALRERLGAVEAHLGIDEVTT